MIKRPILTIAMVLAMAIAVAYYWVPQIFINFVDFEDCETISVNGIVYKTETKSSGIYLYIKKVKAVSADHDGNAHNVNKALLLITEAEYKESGIKAGNTVSAECSFRQFKKARNLGNYDEEAYYRSLGISFKAQVNRICVTDGKESYLNQFFSDAGNKMKNSIYAAVQEDETAGILNAICTGDKSGLSEDTKRLYRESGIIHILAISGLHISMIGMTVFRMLRKKIRFIFSAALSIGLMMGLCIISNASPSALRATIMFIIQLGAIGLGKNYDILCSMALAGIVILLGEPAYIANSGFQFSFAAIVAVGALGSEMNEYISTANKILNGFVVSFCIFLISLPISASMYYEISPYSVLLNIIVIPVMSFVLGAGMMASLWGMLSFTIGRFFCGLGVYIVRMIEILCSINEKLPWNTIVTGKPVTARIIIYYGLIICGVVILKIYNRNRASDSRGKDKKRKSNCKIRIFIVTVIAALLIVFLLSGHKSGCLKIVMIDVGQGDCILVVSPEGTTYLIDGGSSSVKDVAQYRVSGALKALAISSIDYAIITHPDIDHSCAISELMKNRNEYGINIKKLFLTYVPDNEYYEALVNAARECNVPSENLSAGMKIREGDLSITCLHPDKNYRGENSNSYSAVLDLRYGGFSALFTGDLENDGEKIILSAYENSFPSRGYDLLKVAHHGSRNSSSADFIDKVSPKLAIISAGVNNSYGHPHSDTLERLQNAGSQVYCTKECGEITIEVDAAGKICLSHFLG